MQPLLLDADIFYLYDGSLEGLLSAVFLAFDSKENPSDILVEEGLQYSLLGSYQSVSTDLDHAERVMTGIVSTLGARCYEEVRSVYLSDEDHKGGVILRFLQYAFKHGRHSLLHLAHPAVNEFKEMLLRVTNEAHFIMMFARFAELEGGVFFARVEPRANVVPIVMEHFAERFNIQPFVLFDRAHQLAGVFDTSSWWLVDTRRLDVTFPDNSRSEEGFQSLWQTFFDTIAIEERHNPVCQRNFMPKRFWGTLCEQIPPELRKRRPSTETPSQAAKRAARLTGTVAAHGEIAGQGHDAQAGPCALEAGSCP
ncbi:MAG: TIGR03915 family putative DNA repair protein [Coriobacteriales bacterium]|jgi:probable DNA metabolism protein|nr:TIGR03915 family putative DNA repair protein [Coriobacteriales bacterium]